MKTIILILLIFLNGIAITFGQENKTRFIHPGLLRAQATIAPGLLLQENANTIDLHGNLEYYIDKHISIRGDAFFLMHANFNSGINPLHYNHAIFSGASYHFSTKNHFDPYLAFEPGISMTELILNPCPDGAECLVPPIYGNKAVNPMISSAAGFNYYFERWFHLFCEARYSYGKHLSGSSEPLSLSQLRFSFGLGFNLDFIKKKS